MSTFENTFYLSSVSFPRAKAALLGTRFADLRSVPETGSTNADVRTLLGSAGRSGIASPSPIVLLADHQTAGRGRLDRSWEAPAGASILMSIGLVVGELPAERRGLLTTCLALAVVDATAEAGLGQVRIKWPNDLVVEVPTDAPSGAGYRKLGGILAELHPVEGVGDCVVAGLGLNVNWPDVPAELAATATSLNRLAGHDLDREDLVIGILRSLDAVRLPQLETSAPPTALAAAYRQHSATLDRRVRIELPDGELTGVATDVTADGALVVDDDRGERHTVTVGDVVHLRPVRDDG
jgi:BirA family transcriptional regulator, biotin operon repressor / biotin---[acetyl-CoA-carboxylase] ligase